MSGMVHRSRLRPSGYRRQPGPGRPPGGRGHRRVQAQDRLPARVVVPQVTHYDIGHILKLYVVVCTYLNSRHSTSPVRITNLANSQP